MLSASWGHNLLDSLLGLLPSLLQFLLSLLASSLVTDAVVRLVSTAVVDIVCNGVFVWSVAICLISLAVSCVACTLFSPDFSRIFTLILYFQQFIKLYFLSLV